MRILIPMAINRDLMLVGLIGFAITAGNAKGIMVCFDAVTAFLHGAMHLQKKRHLQEICLVTIIAGNKKLPWNLKRYS